MNALQSTKHVFNRFIDIRCHNYTLVTLHYIARHVVDTAIGQWPDVG